jgi:1-aminocyclopropane-1-carboxylate deaminase/D-cysteine desulfhydrase-like pyridoxal-dependent ACC family enzyme
MTKPHLKLQQGRQVVEELIAAFPRRRLFNTPSPIQRLKRLEAALESPVGIYIKRDDLLRPYCGNKLRYLEYVLGAFDETESDCLVHCGGQSSNYLAQIAIISAAINIPAHLVLLGEAPTLLGGNILLEQIFGAKLYFKDGKFGGSCSKHKAELARQLINEGHKPYVIDFPFSNHSAILGYAAAYLEMLSQWETGEAPKPAHIYMCSAGNSYLGLRIAADLAGGDLDILAFPPLSWSDSGLQDIAGNRTEFLTKKIDEFAGFSGLDIPKTGIRYDDTFVGEGYGIPSPDSIKAVELVASTEGILLDPIYTGKAMAGLFSHIKNGAPDLTGNVLFIHSGGAINIFNHTKDFFHNA